METQFILKTRVGEVRETTKFMKSSALVAAIRAFLDANEIGRFRVTKRVVAIKAPKEVKAA